MNTDRGEIPFGGPHEAHQREKDAIVIRVYPRLILPQFPPFLIICELLLAERYERGLVIVAHAAVNNVMLPLLCPELRGRAGTCLGLSYTGVWELEGDGSEFLVVRRNDTGHLGHIRHSG